MNTPAPVATSWRLLRGAVLAAVVLSFGAIAHLTSGGRLPGPGWFVVLAVLLTWWGARFLARPASRTRVLALVVGGQAAVHIALTALAGHRGDGVTGPLVRTAPTPAPVQVPDDVWTRTHRVGSLADQLMVGRPPSTQATFEVPEWVLHLWADLQPQQLPMMLAHALAAAAVGWWLAQGESALWTLVALGTRPLARLGVLLRALAVPSVVRLRRLPAPLLLPLVPAVADPGGGVVRRGPPSGRAA